MRSSIQRALGIGILALGVGCGPSSTGQGGDDDDDDDDDSDVDASRGIDEFADAAPEAACNKMDIVFIIDDSGSMGEEQTNLAANFQVFANLINDYRTESDEPLDYRVAITTTGRTITIIQESPQIPGLPPLPPITTTAVGRNGAFVNTCGMPRQWLERDDADMAGKFSCAAAVGINGPGAEMPLYAMELALVDRIADGTNGTFLREDALLAVVVLTDENDCSRTDDNITLAPFDDADTVLCAPGTAPLMPVNHFLQTLDTLKGERGRWASAVIAGPGPGQCTSAFGDAAEATRLKEFVTGAGATSAIFSSICDGDLASSLTAALDLFQTACEGFPPIP